MGQNFATLYTHSKYPTFAFLLMSDPLTDSLHPRRHISVRTSTAKHILTTLVYLPETQLPIPHIFPFKYAHMSSRMATCIFCKIIKGV